ncbi:MAG: GTP-binding protein [Candidatus Heimdallarchaeota archaeon]
MTEIEREFVFKMVLMGEGSVGKTSIRSKFMGVGFKSEYIKTIGADFASKAVVVGKNKVHFQIWDLAGQKMYRHVRSSFYSGCKCGFLVFDLTQPETLEKLDMWVDEAIEHSNGFIKIFIIVGNKNDLKDQRKVKREDVDKLLKKLQAMEDIDAAYIETSAKTGENIQEAFEMMGKMFLEREGFPRKGQGTEIDDVTLERHHQEILPLISVPGAPIKDEAAKQKETEEIDLSGLSTEEVQGIMKTILDKINQLTQITTALEERLLLIEAKKGSTTSTSADLTEIKSKIDLLERQLEQFSIAVDHTPSQEKTVTDFPTTETRPTIPVPSMDEIKKTDVLPEVPKFEVLDRASLDSMKVVEDEEEEEEQITQILEQTEKISAETQEIAATKEEGKKKGKEPEKKEESKKTPQRCPRCGSKLAFIKQYKRWYCYHCKIYV